MTELKRKKTLILNIIGESSKLKTNVKFTCIKYATMNVCCNKEGEEATRLTALIDRNKTS